MVPARRGRPHRPSLAAREVAAKAPWRGDPGPGAGGGSSAAPSRALGVGSAAQCRRSGWRSGTGRRPVAVAGTAGGTDSGDGRGPGRGWRAEGSCDLDTRSPPGRGRRRGGGGAGPPPNAPSLHCRGKGMHRPGGRAPGSLLHAGSGEEMWGLKDRAGLESGNEFIARVVEMFSPGQAAKRTNAGPA